MVSIMEIMQLCRLCLVKEQVNIPIFEEQGEIRQIFLKITACLPVKVSKEDKLPKKICDGCLYKLELLYQFWNTTANAEKQLLSWLEQTSMDLNSKPLGDSTSQSQPSEHAVKQEKIEPSESTNENAELSTEAQSYILQQQQLPYQSDFPFKESQASNVDGADGSENSDEPLSKRRRRRQATKPIPPESLDSSENEAADSMLEMAVTKTEEESESDGDENVDDPEPSKYIAGEDAEQPGPSGLGKGGTDAPLVVVNDLMAYENKLQHICSICLHIFGSKTQFAEHKRTKFTKEEMHICKSCQKPYKSECKLYKHAKQCGKKMKMKKHICDVCDGEFLSPASLELHKMRHAKAYKYNCEMCGKGFYFMRDMETHVACIHDGNKFQCNVCKKSFMSSEYLKRHEEIHKDNYEKSSFMCPYCNRPYESAVGLRLHIKVKHDKVIPVCDICGKTVSSGHLRTHMRTHTGEKPFTCDYCGKAFRSMAQMKTHVIIHTGKKPFTCTTCSKSFTQKSSLNIHMISHTGNMKFECEICFKKFKTKYLLKCHMKSHGTPLSDM